MLLDRTHLVALSLACSCLDVLVVSALLCACHTCLHFALTRVWMCIRCCPPALVLCYACMTHIPQTWVPGTQVAVVQWGVPQGQLPLWSVPLAPSQAHCGGCLHGPTCQAIKLQVVPFRRPKRLTCRRASLAACNEPTNK